MFPVFYVFQKPCSVGVGILESLMLHSFKTAVQTVVQTAIPTQDSVCASVTIGRQMEVCQLQQTRGV